MKALLLLLSITAVALVLAYYFIGAANPIVIYMSDLTEAVHSKSLAFTIDSTGVGEQQRQRSHELDYRGDEGAFCRDCIFLVLRGALRDPL
jgi:hypothetical protein